MGRFHSGNGFAIWLRVNGREMTNIKLEKFAGMTATEDYEIC